MNITSLTALEIGRRYDAIPGQDGQPVLQVIVTRGQPRALLGNQIIAARALRELGASYQGIADVLNDLDPDRPRPISHLAVKTALTGYYK